MENIEFHKHKEYNFVIIIPVVDHSFNICSHPNSLPFASCQSASLLYHMISGNERVKIANSGFQNYVCN
jgi:hypothetical protein